ncbi:MAG: hypothetical protein ACLU5J_07900 [Christensenellales bacterium]
MHKAMVTGDYGPDPVAKFKISFGIYAIAGFILCGIFQVIFALIENKMNNDSLAILIFFVKPIVYFIAV